MPGFATLDETLLRQPDGGAVAVWGATGLGVATGHGQLAAGFLETVQPNAASFVGLATLAGKLRLATQQPGYLDLLDTFTLLGDPTTPLRLTTTTAVYLPLIRH
jgi:hypothetical protein